MWFPLENEHLLALKIKEQRVKNFEVKGMN